MPRSDSDLRWRLRRWLREIVLACALTVAAIVYLVATTGADRARPVTPQRSGAIETPGKG